MLRKYRKPDKAKQSTQNLSTLESSVDHLHWAGYLMPSPPISQGICNCTLSLRLHGQHVHQQKLLPTEHMSFSVLDQLQWCNHNGFLLACPTMYLSSLSTTSFGVMLMSDRSAYKWLVIEATVTAQVMLKLLAACVLVHQSILSYPVISCQVACTWG